MDKIETIKCGEPAEVRILNIGDRPSNYCWACYEDVVAYMRETGAGRVVMDTEVESGARCEQAVENNIISSEEG